MKIGILTHYYESDNYGGVLQAYALVKVLRDMGYDAEQICFPYYLWAELKSRCVQTIEKIETSLKPSLTTEKKSLLFRVVSRLYQSLRYRTIGRIERNRQQKREELERVRRKSIEKNCFASRMRAFQKFRDKIPHSNKVYAANALFMANYDYDAFITGSDQVWNLDWHNPAFFLEFADADKKRVAYAASAGNSMFDELQQQYLKRVLPSFNAISVREQDLVDKCHNIADVDAEWVLDPVLLLDKEDWDRLASERLIAEPYLFCFFYSPTDKAYQVTAQYALAHNLKIVTIPYAMLSTDVKVDDLYGDYRMGTASPSDFISLIKYAECVITDSFHCNVFSLLYDRPFFTVGRGQMNSRILSLTEMFQCKERFCDDSVKQTVEYMNQIDVHLYYKEAYLEMKCKSLDFLKKSLN